MIFHISFIDIHYHELQHLKSVCLIILIFFTDLTSFSVLLGAGSQGTCEPFWNWMTIAATALLLSVIPIMLLIYLALTYSTTFHVIITGHARRVDHEKIIQKIQQSRKEF